MDRLAIDTTFLIDLQNEHRGRGGTRGALAFLRRHASTELLLPSIALGEYLEGFSDPQSWTAQALVSGLRVLDVTSEVAHLYAMTARALRDAGQLIGANDLWIGCTARSAGVAILTRNLDHFRRVPALEVIGYATA